MPQNPKQLENLKKGKATQFKSGGQAARAGHKGGINSGKSKREKKTMNQMAQTFAALKVPEKVQKQLETLGVPKEEAIHQMAVIASMFSAAEKGNVRAAELITQWLEDDKPEDKNGAINEILEAVKSVNND